MASDALARRALLTPALRFALLDTQGKPPPSAVRLHLTNVDESVWWATFSDSPQPAVHDAQREPSGTQGAVRATVHQDDADLRPPEPGALAGRVAKTKRPATPVAMPEPVRQSDADAGESGGERSRSS